MREPVLISGALIGSRELITELGEDADKLARQVGLPARVFDEPDLFVPAGQIVDFLELAAQRCHCPVFALRQVRRLPLGQHGLDIRGQRWMTAADASTLRVALSTFVAQYGLYTDAGSLRMQPHRGGLWLSYVFLPVGRWGERQIIHLTLARLMLFVGECLGRAWRPREVTFREVPRDRQAFVEFFGPAVKFGAERDAFFIDSASLNTALVRGPELTLSANTRRRCEVLVGAALQAEVIAVLSALLPRGECSHIAVARALGVAPRSLQRRLAAAGSGFRELLEQVRADLAWRQVARTDLSFARLAELLGYDGQAAFTRAFKRWYEMTPRQARRTA